MFTSGASPASPSSWAQHHPKHHSSIDENRMRVAFRFHRSFVFKQYLNRNFPFKTLCKIIIFSPHRALPSASSGGWGEEPWNEGRRLESGAILWRTDRDERLYFIFKSEIIEPKMFNHGLEWSPLGERSSYIRRPTDTLRTWPDPQVYIYMVVWGIH